MNHLALLLATATLLLSACATKTETAEVRPQMKCDVVDAPTGSRLSRRENCVPAPEAARKQ